MGWERWSQKGETAQAHVSALEPVSNPQCLAFQTLVLVGCFSVFWTIYYMLEVCLSQRSMASTHSCRRGRCPWPPRSQNSREVGTELESMPLCNSKDLDRVDSENGGHTTASSFLAPELLSEGDLNLPQSSKNVLDCLPPQVPDLLQGKDGQIC